MNIYKRKKIKSQRISSYDRTGGNKDWVDIGINECHIININNGFPSNIKHIWCTIGSEELYYLRNVIIKIYWDEEKHPSVISPIGDLFGVGFAIEKEMDSYFIQRTPDNGRGMNIYFPMPFKSTAKILICNETGEPITFYYNIDVEIDENLEDFLYFHAKYNHVREVEGWSDCVHLSKEVGFNKEIPWMPNKWSVTNLYGEKNYEILHTHGEGIYVGTILNIDNFKVQTNHWYGEGDEMIFIDGSDTPTINGTGTEDYFNTAFGPSKEYCSNFHGITVYSGKNYGRKWAGKNSMYRFHLHDPIYFSTEIKFTIEHGHANKLSNDYSSVAFWYQTEPHTPFEGIDKETRIPRG